MSSIQTGILCFYVFQFTSFSAVLVNWGLAVMACISKALFRVLLARDTFRFLLMTSVSGVSVVSPGLDSPPGVSNAPRASFTRETGRSIKYQCTIYGFKPLHQRAKIVLVSLDSEAPNLKVERRPEELVSAQETRRRVQLQGGLVLRGVLSAALRVLFGGADVLFGPHLSQHRAEHFAPEATQVQRSDDLSGLETQQRDLWRQACWRRHGRLLGATDKTLVFPLCRRRRRRTNVVVKAQGTINSHHNNTQQR